MLVYGDSKRRRRTSAMLDAVYRGGPDAIFEASELAQGLIDGQFRALGVDDLTDLHRACLGLVDAVIRRQDVTAAAARVRAQTLPAQIETTTPEGYAFYAVYPEAYARAARGIRWSSPPLVIGLRSIGVGLAAIVAAATGGSAVTLRPIGHPFRRRAEVSPALRERLRAHGGEFAIVDEGPGLSGSSFAAAAELLEGLGIARDRIVFFPSHAGAPGAEASAAARERWATARRVVTTLDDLLADDPIAGWFEDLIGPASGVRDMSGGRWRPPHLPPPADPTRERRKFHLTTKDGEYVARFAGLGGIGEAKFRRAEVLHAAGLTPEPIAFRRGFLLERWEKGALLRPGEAPAVGRLARYIALRARAFPADTEYGADPQALAEMIAANSGVQLAPPPRRPRLHIDGRLQAWEWRRRPDGRVIKLDGLDHSCAHDLIGCQPVEYDVAGAIVEHDLSAAATERLLQGIAQSGGPVVDRQALPFFREAYVSFQKGLWSLAPPSAEVLARREHIRRCEAARGVPPPAASR